METIYEILDCFTVAQWMILLVGVKLFLGTGYLLEVAAHDPNFRPRRSLVVMWALWTYAFIASLAMT